MHQSVTWAAGPKLAVYCCLLLALGLCAQTRAQVQAQSRCEATAAKIVSIEGEAQWRAPGVPQWQPASAGLEFCVGDTLRIQDSRATLRLPNETVVRLKENTTLKFLPPEKTFWMELLEGAAHFITRTPEPFKAKTPYFNAAIKGTEFTLAAGPGGDTVAVFEGEMEVANGLGQLSLQAGEAAVAQAGTAPQKVATVNLRDTVSWALYFPPLPVPDSTPERIGQAIAAGRLREAGEYLAALPATQQSAELLALASALALYRGRVDTAATLLDRALQRDAGAPAAVALQSIRQMMAGDREGALNRARANTATAPDSSAAWLALSYIQQSLFRLEDASASARRALDLDADSGLLQARMAELALMSGEYKKADRYARSATTLSPNLSRTHTVAGFAALNRFQLKKARQLFQRAAQLDAADPMPQLGLGLIEVRKGRLAAGREHFETAVAQDPGNALIRSYLGKAYYEERRNNLADPQYDLARQLDPADPTPWFYQALRKQSDNQLIEALTDLDTAVERNDNRAVYRSRLLLDNDNAARGANQARIYRALRFDQLAILKGAEAVSQAPGEYSGHRLLAEVYADRPQLESLRASEGLLATLLAPLGAQPLPLGLRETGLLVVDGAGPADMGFNEYNPLFIQDGLSGRLSGLGGTQDTNAYEWNLNGLWGNASLNLGQYKYKTDGFRANNNVEYEISNLLAQYQATPDLGVQIELRRREEERGDIALQFDLDEFSENLRVNRDTDSARIGINYTLSPHSRLLGSLVKTDAESKTNDRQEIFPGFEIDLSSTADSQIERAELQYQLKANNINWILGAHHANTDGKLTTLSGLPTTRLLDAQFDSFYGYSFWPILNDSLKITAALSYTDYDFEVTGGILNTVILSENEINPKLGVEWDLPSGLTLRAAALKSFSPGANSQISLEPTHVAGFAQKYDDSQGTKSDLFGIAIDYTRSSAAKLSIEYLNRDIEVANLAVNVDPFEIENDIFRVNVYYALNNTVSLALNYQQENFERERQPGAQSPALPMELDTRLLPLTVNVLTGSYTTFSLTANIIAQKVQTEPIDLFGPVNIPPLSISDKDRFWTLDSSISLRLPKRRGVITLGLRNLLDEEFRYRDFNFFTATPRPQQLIPERSAFVKLNLAF